MIKKMVAVLAALVIGCISVGLASEDSLFSMRDKNEKVTALHEKLTELGFYFMFCDIEYSAFTEIALKKLQNAMGWEETGKVKDEEELERILNLEKQVVEEKKAENKTPLIEMGDSGKFVTALHEKLAELGLYNGEIDSEFNAESEAGVKILQYTLGSDETGVVRDKEEFENILSVKINENCENLATGTEEEITVSPVGINKWCDPMNVYPTSENGMELLADSKNKYFTVSFDWMATEVDTSVNASISLCRSGEQTLYGSVGIFSLPIGESKGHCLVTFTPTDEMRQFGTGWLISRVGEKNRNLKLTLTNFKLVETPELFLVD